MQIKNILITGNAGFIGMHLFQKLRHQYLLTGIDNLNNYYDPTLKLKRLKEEGFEVRDTSPASYHNLLNPDSVFYCADVSDKEKIREIFKTHRFDVVIHLAAQAGVRYSLENPDVYIQSNVNGFLNIIEQCRHYSVKHLIFASSSSVYGLNTKMPFSVDDLTDHPVSLYGATKKTNELMAHAYAHLFGTPTTGLRFFTVYGPYGRPDMAIFKFTDSIIQQKPIEVFNNGNMKRDFTYIDDICESIARLVEKPPAADPAYDHAIPTSSRSSAPFRLFNIGNQAPVNLMDFIKEIERHTGKKAIMSYKELQAGDVLNTYADVSELVDCIEYHPQTDISEGVKSFVNWYTSFYNI